MGDGENEKRLTPEERHEQLTKAARRIVDAEKSAQDKKTAKLKAQRLANEPREPNTAPKPKREALNKREKQLGSIKDNINAARDIHGINEVSLALVREAVASLEAEGRPIDGITKKEEVVAKRILRLHPGSVAI